MRLRLGGLLLTLTAYVSTPQPVPRSVVLNLYREIVARHPLGIPQGPDRTAINPFLSRALTQSLETAQACEQDYFDQHPEKSSKPPFSWLELDLFSGKNEQAIPVAAVVKRTE